MERGKTRLHPKMQSFSRSDSPPQTVAEAFSQSETNSGFNSQTSIQQKTNISLGSSPTRSKATTSHHSCYSKHIPRYSKRRPVSNF